MKDKPNRPTRSVPPTSRPRPPQRGTGRGQASKQNPRSRQLIAVGALVLVLAVIAGVVILLNPGQNTPSSGNGSLTGALPNEAVGHFRGSANAPVTVTEWSDFQ